MIHARNSLLQLAIVIRMEVAQGELSNENVELLTAACSELITLVTACKSLI